MGRGIRFTAEFKREAVRLALTSGRPRAEIAEDLGVGLSSLTRWVGQYRDEEMPPEIIGLRSRRTLGSVIIADALGRSISR